MGGEFSQNGLYKDMSRLRKKTSHLQAHTWKDIGGIGGLLIEAAYFVFLIIVSGFVLLIGTIVVILSYLFHPLLDLLSLYGAGKQTFVDDTILLDNGTLTTRPSASPVSLKPAPQPMLQFKA
jgi:fatty acid desaturase